MDKNNIQRRFLLKARKYNPFPALIKNSPCDHNAKVCLKDGYVKLVKSTKTGNTYKITPKGYRFINKELELRRRIKRIK